MSGDEVASTALAQTLASDTPRSGEIEPRPQHVARFEVVSALGEGGMGMVLLANDPLLQRQIALKLLKRSRHDDVATSERRMLREAQAMAQVSHENVIVVHEVGTYDAGVYIAMEYIAGATLKTWQVDRGWREVLAMYATAGRGLVAAHEAGLVHRDFKPDNVLVGKDGKARVTDFGLVGVREAVTESGPRDELSSSLTQTGAVVGTPRYMAPEQHAGEPVDARADQFSFCAALYEALFRTAPFPGDTRGELAASVLDGRLRPITDDRGVPRRVRDAIVRGLSRDRADRFATMNELLAELAVVEPATRARRWPWAVLALAALAALAIVVWRLGATEPEAPAPVDTRTAEELYKRGETQFNLGRFDEAAAVFELAYEREPDDKRRIAYLSNAAQSYRRGGKCERAALLLRNYLAMKRGLAGEKTEELLDRLAELEACAKGEPAPKPSPEVQAAHAEGDRLYSLGKFTEAIAAFERGFSMPDATPRQKAQFLHNIAQCHRQLKNCDRAAFFYRRYLDTAPVLGAARRAELEQRIIELRACATGSGSSR